MHLKYLSYVLRHKWYVFKAALKLGIPWLGLIHDLSKFLPDEWLPFARYFYGRKPYAKRDPIGYFHEPASHIDTAFDYAWLLHQKRNKHHWQWWVLREDDGGTKVLAMPDRYRREMLADWQGAGLAQGYGDNTKPWYEANKDKMRLHPNTRRWIELKLGEL